MKKPNTTSFTYSSPSLVSFTTLLAQESSLLVEGLWDTPKALLLKLIQHTLKLPILVITSETRESKLLDDCPYFDLSSVLDFPAWETLPGEQIAPSPDLVGKRFHVLHTLLTTSSPPLVLAPLQAVLQKMVSPSTLKPLLHVWKKGSKIPFSSLPSFLTSLGYRRAAVVVDKGEFALRGGILDIFPLASPAPYRLDFFEDTLEALRTFDPIGQKTTGKQDSLFLCPGEELSLLSQEKHLSTVLDYLGKNTLLVFDDLLSLEDKYLSFQKLSSLHKDTFLTFDALLKLSHTYHSLYWTKEAVSSLSDVHIERPVGRAYYTGETPLQPLSFEVFHTPLKTKRWNHPFVEVQGLFPSLSSLSTLLLVASSAAEEELLKQKLHPPAHATFEKGYLSSGFALPDASLAVIPLTELTHRPKIRREKWRSTVHTPASDFHELSPGDLVVHFHNGIGKFLGIEKQKNHTGTETEFLAIEYAEKSKLFVPFSQAYLVSRYIGAHEETPTLHTLGTKNWHNTKQKAQTAILGYAQDLLRLQAEREIKGGVAFPSDTDAMRAFEEAFPYSETEDQLQAIAAIKKEMCSPKAMDHLLCGDVGYGKTEVAMRAAFKAAYEGKKQVAVLVPTTILALQHFETFSARMEDFPLQIRLLSRFQSAKEVKKIIQETADGKVDILIGTHRLISKDVVFKELGLLIIDEEQRFGVRAKEHLKTLKVGVDCLTLTATPIPRTLYLSLVGARPVSVINTPPQDRLPIKTVIAEKNPETIRTALLRELSRDGQAFFIHNRVESLPLVKEELQKLLPEAKFVSAHGQMNPEEIDYVFHLFKKGEADVLISTTLVENGVDIPNANTILINRSDQFGLSDLYQLRGRVGRWNRPAYAYFLKPANTPLPEIALKRLYALVEAQGYGGGMKIALRDLEIRGAGDILGTQQSGQISSIGFHLYCKLLKKTVSALQNKKEPSFTETKLEFPYPASLPVHYIGETSIRLEIYHRLGETASVAEVDDILSELRDRFGEPPAEVLWLYHLTRLRTLAAAQRYTLLKFSSHTLYTEQLHGKEVRKKTISLPQINKPDQLEKVAMKELRL